MKIVDRATFLAMPRGTLFAKINTGFVGQLQLKLSTVGSDFVNREMIEVDAESSDVYSDLLWRACGELSINELPLDWEPNMARDGLFDAGQMFAVLVPEEVTALIEMLTAARDGAI